MNKLLKTSAILLSAFSLIFLAGCNKDPEIPRGETPSQEENIVYYPASGKTKTVRFATGNLSPVTHDCEDSWVTVVPLSNGSEFDIAVQANTSASERKTKVVLTATADNQTKTFTIHQYAKNTPAPTSAPYTLGDIYFENGVAGIVYKITNGGNNGMIISLKSTLCEWSKDPMLVGCSDQNNGVNNMNAIKRITGWQTKFPAFAWCETLNTGGVSGWYLPAVNELKDLYAGFSGLSAYPGYVPGAEEGLYAAARSKFNHNMLFYDGNDLEVNRAYGSSTEHEASIYGDKCDKAYFAEMGVAAYGGRTKSFDSRFHAVRPF